MLHSGVPPTTEAPSSLRVKGLPGDTGPPRDKRAASRVCIMLQGRRGSADLSKVLELEIGKRSKLFGEPNLITGALKSQEPSHVPTELRRTEQSKRLGYVKGPLRHCWL